MLDAVSRVSGNDWERQVTCSRRAVGLPAVAA